MSILFYIVSGFFFVMAVAHYNDDQDDEAHTLMAISALWAIAASL